MSIIKAFETLFKLKEKAQRRDQLLIELEASLITRSLKEASQTTKNKEDDFYIKQLNDEAWVKVKRGKDKMQELMHQGTRFLSCNHEGETPFELRFKEEPRPRIVCHKCALANMKDYQKLKREQNEASRR
tara:strand:+ start:197 stop:586 length:390 start_codon:yes stop_codon:yes gene_type:complete